VQTGLDTLAKNDGLSDPSSTQLVSLNNVNGIETYSVTIDGTGTVSRLTVDQNGQPVTQPTQSTTTWATLDGTGMGSDAAAAGEISAIATALSLTAPTATTVINVNTSATGVVTYSLMLSSSSSSSDSTSTQYMPANFGVNVIVDAAGNPVGNQRLPFSVLPSAIQTALNKNAPTGATALADTSTQSVDVRNVDGVQTYTVPFTVSGTTTTVTVDITGDLVSLPSSSTTTFSDLSSIVQTELQTLATADGVTGTISSTQSVMVLTETNGTVLYSITVSVDGTSHTYDITLTVDADGNPTTLPMGPGGGPPPQADPGSSGDGDDDGDSGSGSSSSGSSSSGDSGTGTPVDCPPGNSGSSSSGDSSSGSSGSGDSSSGSGDSSSDSGDSGGTVSTPISLGTQSSSSSVSSPAVYGMTAKILASATDGLGALAGLFVQFIPADADSAVQADLTKIHGDVQQSASDLKGLDSADRATLRTDLTGIQSAIKAMSSTLSPLQATFKTDVATWNATLRTDKKAIRKDRNDATAIAADKAQLQTDQAAAFTALAGDASAILTAINGNSGVEAAQKQLTTDLPTIAADQTTLSTDVTQLVSDIESQLSAE
jgi:hypothetical protein